MRSRTRLVGIALKASIALGFLGALLWYGSGPAAHWDVIRRAAPAALVACVIACTIDRALMSWKWLRLLRARGLELGLVRGLEIYCASMVWGFFLPSTVGPDVIRAACTRAAGLPLRDVLASVAVERVLGLVVAAIVALLSLVLFRTLGGIAPGLAPLWWGATFLLLAAVGLLLTSLSELWFTILHDRLLGRFAERRIVRALADLHRSYLGYRDARGELAIFGVLTLLETALTIGIFWGVALALSVDVELLQMAAAVPLAFLASRLPISLSGLGVFEAGLVAVLAAFGVSTEKSLSIALVGRALQIAAWLPWWASYSLRRGSLRRPAGYAADSAARTSETNAPTS